MLFMLGRSNLDLSFVYNVCYAVRISRVADVVGGGSTGRSWSLHP